jgi:hypothetical protein
MNSMEDYRTIMRGRRGHDRMVVGFTITCAIGAHQNCEFESHSWQGIHDTTLVIM